MNRLAWLSAVLVFSAGCLDATQVTFDITTDVPCERVGAVAISVGLEGQTERSEPVKVVTDCRPNGMVGAIGTRAVTPKNGKLVNASIRLAMAVGEGADPKIECAATQISDNCIVARRRISFVSHRSLRVPIEMFLACTGVECDENSTCNRAGRCVSSKVDTSQCGADGTCGQLETVPGEGLPCSPADSLFCYGENTWCTVSPQGERACVPAPVAGNQSYQCRDLRDCGKDQQCILGSDGVLGRCTTVVSTNDVVLCVPGVSACPNGQPCSVDAGLTLVACETPDAGFDGGSIDSGFIDAGPFDAGFIDAGFDAGPVDAGVDAGTPPAPILGFTPAGPIAFGLVDAGSTSPAVTVTLANTGNANATGCSAITVSSPQQFSIQNDTCALNALPAESSCTFDVVANPTSGASTMATVSRTCQVGGTVSAQVSVVGRTISLGWMQPTHNFGPVPLNSMTPTIMMLLINSGTGVSAPCTAPVLSNTTHFRLISSDCNGPLGAGASCVAQVDATPTMVGLQTTTLTANCGADGLAVAQLSVTGTAPSLAWNPMSQGFGNVAVGSSSTTQPIELVNSGTGAALGCTAPVLSDTTNFTIASDRCAISSLAAMSSCVVDVRANPGSVGVKSATLTRTCATGGAVVAQLTVTGVSSTLQWAPTSYDFTTVPVNSTSATQTFTLTNIGSTFESGCSAPVISDTTNFAIVGTTCGAAIPVASGCSVDVQATPRSAATHGATLSITCASGTVSTAANRINVTGTQPSLSWSPLAYTFNSTPVASSSLPQTFTLTNGGAQAATGCSAPVLTDTTNFTLSADTCGTNNLAANNGTCTVQVAATPLNAGLQTATLSRTCTVGGTVSTTANQIRVTATQPVLSWSPLANTFGSVLVGSPSATVPFTLSNTGTGSATGCSAPQVSDTTNFTVVNHTCTAVPFPQMSTCVANVRANPTTRGVKTATLTRSCVNASASTTVNALTATGEQPILAWAPNNVNFGTITVGSTSTASTFTMTNTGLDAVGGCTAASLNDTVNYRIVRDTCGTSNLAAVSGSCQVDVVAAPTSTGSKPATLTRTCTVGTNSIVSNALLASVGATPLIRGPVATGVNHSCVVLSDGSVRCWGTNSNGELGNGTTTASPTTPVAVTGIANARQVAVYYHSCALLSDSTVKCWGPNQFGQLGDGTQTGSLVPVRVNGLNRVKQIAVAEATTCALRDNGAVACWGFNSSGQVGNGTVSLQQLTPVTVTGVTDAVSIAAGVLQFFAVGSDGRVRGWGNNEFGQLGDGTANNAPTPVGVASLLDTRSVVSGWKHSCAARADGTVSCWGGDDRGQLGNGAAGESFTPQPVAGLATTVTSLSGGHSHTCARLSNGATQCWGWNSNGQIGAALPIGTDATSPVTLSGLGASQTLSGGYQGTCAGMANGGVSCWGSLGSSGATPSAIAGLGNLSVVGLNPVRSLAGGFEHTCASMADGTSRCWGYNIWGGLGNGLTSNSASPVTVQGLGNSIQAASGEHFSCGLTADGSPWCWGWNSVGQAGDPGLMPVLNALRIGVASATSIELGGAHACARQAQGTAMCWGLNGSGQLGDRTTTNSALPVPVQGLTLAMDLATGVAHTCALTGNGQVGCWGNNQYGQLGDGTQNSSLLPVSVSGVSGLLTIASGNSHTCGLLSDGRMNCWGFNQYGQLGDGSTMLRTTPILVPGLTDAISLSAGQGHVCALMVNGTLKCWGRNNLGQVGNGGTTDVLSPYTVPFVRDVVSVVAGDQFTCALLADSTVRCWGNGGSGQLGNGSFLNAFSPVTVQ